MAIETARGVMKVRPMSGLPRFKRNACVQFKDGTISATNRWGKTRSFPLSGAENSPKQAGGAFNPGIDVWWLEDEQAQLLLVVELEHFWPVEIGKLVDTAGLPERDGALSDHVLPMRADVFKVRDLPTVNFGIACGAIGSAAVALRWLGVLSEWIMLAIAVPTLIAALLCILVNKLTGPKGKDKEHQDYLLTHQKELFASTEEDLDELERSLPDFVKEPRPEPGGEAGSSAEQVDGS